MDINKQALSFVGPSFEELDTHEMMESNGGGTPSIIVTAFTAGVAYSAGRAVSNWVTNRLLP